MVLQSSKTVDDMGAQGWVNVLRGELAPVWSVVGPGAPVTDNLGYQLINSNLYAHICKQLYNSHIAINVSDYH